MKKITVGIIFSAIILSGLVIINIQLLSENTEKDIRLENVPEPKDTRTFDANSILSECNIEERCIVESLQILAKQQDDKIVYATVDKIMSHIASAGRFF